MYHTDSDIMQLYNFSINDTSQAVSIYIISLPTKDRNPPGILNASFQSSQHVHVSLLATSSYLESDEIDKAKVKDQNKIKFAYFHHWYQRYHNI